MLKNLNPDLQLQGYCTPSEDTRAIHIGDAYGPLHWSSSAEPTSIAAWQQQEQLGIEF